MCGICGVALRGHGDVPSPTRLSEMTDILRHRGPDDRGVFRAPGIGLGVRRLSIVDLEMGAQPIYSEDRRLVLVCNGEIYNAPELRDELVAAGHKFGSRSDAEVIVHLYEAEGPELVQRLRGMFAFALWDSERRRLMLARDRFGIKPLCYALTQEGLCFGSEMKSILVGNDSTPSIDPRAVRNLFEFGYVLSPRTIFRGIEQLPPAHYLLYQDGSISLRRYWSICFPCRGEYDTSRPAEDWAEELLAKLADSVRVHLRSDVPVASWLSAGLDSSAITALAAEITKRPMDTHSLTFEDDRFDEMRSQRTLADFHGCIRSNRREHITDSALEDLPKALWYSETPTVSGIEIVKQRLARLSSRSHKVVLTGEGSDEMFGGYMWFWSDKVLRPLARLPLPLRKLMLLGPLLPRMFPRASRIHLAPGRMNLERYKALTLAEASPPPPPPFSGELRRALASSEGTDDGPEKPDDFDRWHPFAQLQFFEQSVRLPSFIVHMLDRDSMAASLEARVPFLDHELAEFCARIPPRLKMRGRREKHILREAVGTLLPTEIVNRRKRGLRAPVAMWLQGPLPEFAQELLSERSVRAKGYFDPSGVNSLLRRHRAGSRVCAKALMACLVTQLVDEIFISKANIRNRM